MDDSNLKVTYQAIRSSLMASLVYTVLIALVVLINVVSEVLANGDASLYSDLMWFTAGLALFSYLIAIYKALPAARLRIALTLPAAGAVIALPTPIAVQIIFAGAVLIMAGDFYLQLQRDHAPRS